MEDLDRCMTPCVDMMLNRGKDPSLSPTKEQQTDYPDLYTCVYILGPPVVPAYPFLEEGFPTKIDY